MTQGEGYAASTSHLKEGRIAFLDVVSLIDDPLLRPYPFPFGALSLAGEEARKRHDSLLADFEREITWGIAEAKAIGEAFGKTELNYVQAENSSLRALMGDTTEGRHPLRSSPNDHYGSRVYFPDYDDLEEGAGDRYEWKGKSYSWRELPGNVTVDGDRSSFLRDNVEITGTLSVGLGSLMHAISKMDDMTTARNDALHRNTFRMTQLAVKSDATWQAARRGRNYSFALMAGTAIWATMIVPFDEWIDERIEKWMGWGYGLSHVFGTNPAKVREALKSAWSGEAMNAADRRIAEFYAAGAHFVERTIRMAVALHELVRRLDDLHTKVLITTLSYVGTITALGVTAEVLPPPYKAWMNGMLEVLGGNLGTILAVAAAVGATIYASARLDNLFDHVNDPAEIAGHTITGFRRPEQ